MMMYSTPSALVPEALPEEILRALSDSRTGRYLCFLPDEAQTGPDMAGDTDTDTETVYEFPSLCSPDGKRILLGLENEHTEAGRLLIGSLWYGRTARLILSAEKKQYSCTVSVFRCHIVGPLFSSMLAKARSEDPDADIASAWELHAGAWTIASGERTVFDKKIQRPGKGRFNEMHLDSLSRPCTPSLRQYPTA